MSDDKESSKESGAKDEKDKVEGEPAAEGEAVEGEGVAAPKKKFGKKKLIIFGVIGLVVAGGAGAGGFYFLHSKKSDSTHAVEQANAEAAAKEKAAFFNLGDLLVNLSGEGKHPNFLKVKISLELSDEKDLPAIEAIKPRILDNFQVYLRELRIEDLRGSAGMYRLREELLMRVTEAAQPVRVRDVLFQEMLVQ